MPREREIIALQKAAVYDLQKLLWESRKTEFTLEELFEMMDFYVEGLGNNPAR